MSEEDINKTKMGDVFRVTTENSFIAGGETKHYVHYSDGGAARRRNVTFSLTCLNGVVTEVNDYRDHPLVPSTYTPSTQKPGSNGPYLSPEELLEEYPQLFEDLKEAEEYYEDNFE